PTALYTLSLHDALPIWRLVGDAGEGPLRLACQHEVAGHEIGLPPASLGVDRATGGLEVVIVRALDEIDARASDDLRHHQCALVVDRKSTRLNSSHLVIS